MVNASGEPIPTHIHDLISGNTLTSLLPCGICVFMCDEDISISYANDYFYKFFGYADSLEAKNSGFTSLRSVLQPSDYSNLLERLKRCYCGEIVDFRCKIAREDNDDKFIWLLLRFRYLAECSCTVRKQATENKR